MSEQHNFWTYALNESPEESPFDFLKAQGELLKEQTDGLLWGEVVRFFQRKVTYHEFCIASSRLGDYRCVLFRTAHGDCVYPLFVYDYTGSQDDADEMDRKNHSMPPRKRLMEQFPHQYPQYANQVKADVEKYGGIIADFEYQASDYSEFQSIFATILQSKGTRSVIQSLLVQREPSPAYTQK